MIRATNARLQQLEISHISSIPIEWSCHSVYTLDLSFWARYVL
jgi:hypothetical protein